MNHTTLLFSVKKDWRGTIPVENSTFALKNEQWLTRIHAIFGIKDLCDTESLDKEGNKK
jgi:hypothetical protein